MAQSIIITATADSIRQVKELLDAGVDRIYVGEEEYGLRLPHNFSYDDLREIAYLVHEAGKSLTVAANALMHQGMMDQVAPFLSFCQEIGVDYLVVGDTGLIYVNKRDGYNFPIIYDASVFVTSSRQVNFWKAHGCVEAVLAREIPKAELEDIAKNLQMPAEILVYGASVIHHSKRALLENYYHFIESDETDLSKDRGLFLAEPSDKDSHYSIYEDKHGTHIFMNKDITMMTKLKDLVDMGYCHWKLDGIYCPGDDFVAITKYFIAAKEAFEAGTFTMDQAYVWDEAIRTHHPAGRELDTGFYDYDRNRVK